MLSSWTRCLINHKSPAARRGCHRTLAEEGREETKMKCSLVRTFAGLALLLQSFAVPALGRVTRIEIIKVEPAFEGQGFGAVGRFEHVTGRAHGEIDPGLPENSVIQDILLAPRNARGMVEY